MSEQLTASELQIIENARVVRDAALEQAAEVVDQCNRQGPYQALNAAVHIRALKSRQKASHD